jgi:hypothetical protein
MSQITTSGRVWIPAFAGMTIKNGVISDENLLDLSEAPPKFRIFVAVCVAALHERHITHQTKILHFLHPVVKFYF